MAIEHASDQVARRPWGAADLHPWSSMDERADIEVGRGRTSCLIAYPGPNPLVALLQDPGEQMTDPAGNSFASAKSTENVDAPK